MSEIVSLTNVTKLYGDTIALHKVTLQIEEGEIFGLVGGNGAGKSTMLKLICGMVLPTAGEVSVKNRTATSLASIVEEPTLHVEHSAMNNLKIHARLLGLAQNEEYFAKTIELVGLNPLSKAKVKSFSLGMKQRLAIAVALLCKPELLILDEPMNGLDPQGILELRELLLNLNARGVTIIISSHILAELEKLATKYCFVEKGKVIKIVTMEEICQESENNTRILVNDAVLAIKALKDNGFVAKILSSKEILVKGEQKLSQMVSIFETVGVSVESFSVEAQSVEQYFLKLIGGQSK